MNVSIRHGIILAAVALYAATGISFESFGQQLFMYPAKGQNTAQQSRDRYECHSWSVGQTGFDPSNSNSASAAPPPRAAPPPAEPRRGGLLRGAGRGAALGAVGGAIAGDAGKGAAIGAATGALFGGMRRRAQMRRQQSAQQQYQAQIAQQEAQRRSASGAQRNNYNRAMAACLQGRGYSVTY